MKKCKVVSKGGCYKLEKSTIFSYKSNSKQTHDMKKIVSSKQLIFIGSRDIISLSIS